MGLYQLGQSGVFVVQIVQLAGIDHALSLHPCMVELIVKYLLRKRAKTVVVENVVHK